MCYCPCVGLRNVYVTLQCLSYDSCVWTVHLQNNICTRIAKADEGQALFNSAPVSSPYPGLEMHRPSGLCQLNPSVGVFSHSHKHKLREWPVTLIDGKLDSESSSLSIV